MITPASSRSTPRSARKPRDRREDLIRAGIRLLSDAERTPRVEDITSAADTAKGTFYLYFSSWGAYLAAVRDQLLSDYQREMLSRLEGLGRDNYWALFEGEIENFVRWMQGNGNLHKSVFHGAEVNSPVPTELAADQAIARILERGKEFGHISEEVESSVCARLIFWALHGIVDTRPPTPETDVIRESVRFVHSAVASQADRGR